MVSVIDEHPAARPRRTAVPLHFGPPSRLRFGWYHPAGGAGRRGAGVVLCNTLGNESLRAYGTLRHLAESLAGQGFAVLRFDHHGTGDSGGSEADPDRISTWLEDIDLAIEELRVRSGVREVGLAGLRLGGTLALYVAARRGDVESLVLWDPHLGGKDFVTETTRLHKALAMLEPSGFALKRPEGGDARGVEALGFLLSHETIADLSKIDLLSVAQAPARRVLIVGSEAAKKRGGDALTGHLRALGAEAEYEVLAESMNRNLRLVSARDHAQIAADITRWMTAHLGSSGGTAVAPGPVGRRAEPGKAHPEVDEEPLCFGEHEALFGIATRPERPRQGDDRPAIIVVNAGPGTRIGPHRQYVRMARAWARLGFLVLRVDLSGSGDSAAAGPSENDPYPPRAVSDVQAAMSLLERRFSARRFIVAGVCSGADIAFCAAIEDPRITGAIIMNPRTFALHNIPDLEQLVRSQQLGATVASRKNWRMLLRGDAGLRGSILRIAQVLRTAAMSLKQRVRSLFGRGDAPSTAVDVPAAVRRLLARGVDTLLVVGDRDVGILHVESSFREPMRALEAMRGFRRVDFRGADHLYTLVYAQELLLDTLTDHLRRRYLQAPGVLRPGTP
jgi:pimeloyl-ACP methyl ester carboxylesterase